MRPFLSLFLPAVAILAPFVEADQMTARAQLWAPATDAAGGAEAYAGWAAPGEANAAGDDSNPKPGPAFHLAQLQPAPGPAQPLGASPYYWPASAPFIYKATAPAQGPGANHLAGQADPLGAMTRSWGTIKEVFR